MNQYQSGNASLFSSFARGDILLTSEYWDCECPGDFIRPRKEMSCPVCGAEREYQPDSRVDEVLAHGLPWMPEFVLGRLMNTSDGETAEVIAIKVNETGCYPTTWGRQTEEWVKEMNARMCVDPATQLAYSICSVMGNWSNYANVLKQMKEALNKKAEVGNV